MRPTIAAIAARTRLSKTTVAYILNGAPAHITFSEATRAEVEAVAVELGYRRSRAAKATATGRTGLAAVLHTSGALPETLLWALHDRLAEHGLALTLARLPDPALVAADHVPHVIADWLVDGLILTGDGDESASSLRARERSGLPAIHVGRRAATDAVAPDHRRAGREAAEYHLRAGRRMLAFVGEPTTTADRERHAGFTAACQAAGVRPATTSVEALASSKVLGLVVGEGVDPERLNELPAVAFGVAPRFRRGVAVPTLLDPWSAIGSAAADLLQTRLNGVPSTAGLTLPATWANV